MDETAPPGNIKTPSSPQPQQVSLQQPSQKTQPPPPYQAPPPPQQPSPPPAPPPPQETETPPVSESVSEGFTIETPRSKLWRYILLGVFLILLLVGCSFLFFRKQKNELKDLTQNQLDKINSLQTTYDAIITVIKETPEEEGASTTHQLLGAQISLEEPTAESDQEKVLGLEDSPVIKQARKLGELFREGKSTASEIDSQNFYIGLKINSIPLSLFFSKNKPLIDKTEAYAREARDLLAYLDQDNSFGIKAATLGFELGITIEEAILRGADDQSIQKFEEKINEINKLIDDYRAIDTSSLTEDLRQEHLKEAAKARDEVKIFNEIFNSLKNKDIVALEKSLQSLMIEAISAAETGLVESVSFWQKNPTVRGIEEIKEDWEEFQEEINKFPI